MNASKPLIAGSLASLIAMTLSMASSNASAPRRRVITPCHRVTNRAKTR